MNKKVVLIVVGVILAVAGFLYFTRPAEETAGTPSNHQYSQGSTGIVLVEYGDFECPACASYYPILKEVKEQYKDTVTFQFRHLPLVSIHKNALAAARAAEAAAMQGKFWEMHDRLFENRASWKDTNDPVSLFRTYAEQLGMDGEQFEQDLRSSAVNATVNADIREFNNTGHAQSTPTFFLNGEKVENPVASVDFFRNLLDEAIADRTGSETDNTESQDEPATAPEDEDQTE